MQEYHLFVSSLGCGDFWDLGDRMSFRAEVVASRREPWRADNALRAAARIGKRSYLLTELPRFLVQ